MTKTAVFLDGAYIEKILEIHFGGTRIDFKKMTTALAGKGELLRAYYYHCPPYKSPEPTQDEINRYESKSSFFNALSRIPRFQVKLGRLAYRGNDSQGHPIFIQKSVDVLIAVDMVQLAATRAVDKIVLMAGDSDFEPAMKAVKVHGVVTALYRGPQNGGSDPLWEACDERVQLTKGMINQVQLIRQMA